MDLNRVAIFARVVEHGSFTAAAKSLGLPKSSVSRSVTRLEDDLGVRLLRRTTRQLSVTDAGREYFQRARTALDGLDEAANAVSDREREPQGVVRLTAPVDIGVSVLSDILPRFTAAYPKIHVELSLSARVVDLVEEGFDLAVRAGRLRDSSLVARKLAESPGGLFASPEYLKRKKKPRKLKDLASHDCVLFRAHGGRATWELLGPHGVETVDVGGTVSGDDMMFVQEAVRYGLGIGVLPTFLSGCVARESGFVRVLPDYASQPSTIHLVSPSARQVPVRVALLRDFLFEELRSRLGAK